MIVVATGAYLLLSAYIVWRSAVLQPYSDMFDWIARYDQLQADGNLAAYLLAPHNFHRLGWTMGVLALDIDWFGAHSYFFVASSTACLAVTAALLGREGARAAPVGLRLAGGAFATMLSLLSVNLLAAGLHIHATYLHLLMFAVLAIVMGESSDGRPALAWRRLAVLIFIAAAAFGNAVGLALWPVLLLAGLRARADRRWLSLLACAGGVFIWLYMLDQPRPSSAPLTGGAMNIALMTLNFLGQPWSRALPGLGWVLGLVALALSVAALAAKGGPCSTRAERIATQLILFSLAAAAMAALGRPASDLPWMVSVRYATLLTPMHVGLLMLALPHVARLRAARPGRVDAATAVMAILLVGHQAASGALVIAAADVNRALIAQFRAGDRAPMLRATIHPDLERAADISARLRRQGRYQDEWHVHAAGDVRRTPSH